MSLSNYLPTTAEELLTRYAIQDALYRAVTCLDRPSVEMFETVYTSDATFEMNGNATTGRDQIRENGFKHISKMDTTHFITTVRIDHKEGDKTATATASALAQHYRPGHMKTQDNTHFLGGSLYDMQFAVEDGIWKVKYFRLSIVWYEGDYTILRE